MIARPYRFRTSSLSSLLVTPLTAGTSTATSSATPSYSGLSCPTAGGSYYTDPSSNDLFAIECGYYYPGGDLNGTYSYSGTNPTNVTNFNACISLCANSSGCVGGFFNLPAGSACYLKSALGAMATNANVWGAILTATGTSTVSTPSVSSTATSRFVIIRLCPKQLLMVSVPQQVFQ